MERIIGNFQFFLLRNLSLFFKKKKSKLIVDATKKDISNGLNSLTVPFVSKIVISKKKIEIIGAKFSFPGLINQIPDKIEKESIKNKILRILLLSILKKAKEIIKVKEK
tara:strand:- start:8 stop:334 length:327 start_codon:yes stop_codon:yes gene_type:complete